MKQHQLTDTVRRRIKQQIFRIMKNKLSGPQREQLKTIYRMIKVAQDIYERFGVYPKRFQQRHFKWWIDEVGFWVESDWSEYRFKLAISKFCDCREGSIVRKKFLAKGITLNAASAKR